MDEYFLKHLELYESNKLDNALKLLIKQFITTLDNRRFNMSLGRSMISIVQKKLQVLLTHLI